MGRYGCGCCSESACSCGRKTVIQQSSSSCCNSSSGSRFCKEPVIYVTGNFVVPAAGVEVEVEVSNSARLYVGQGIQIGDGYFQVTEIVDSVTIKVKHNGSATANTTITAVSPTYGCYQYPIYYVGLVEIAYAVDVEDIIGLDGSFVEVADSIIDPVISYTYGKLGPDKIQFNIELTTGIANTPDLIQIPLVGAASSPTAVFSAVLIYNSAPVPLTAYKRGTNLVVGQGSGVAFITDTDAIIYISGEYGV